MKSYNKELVFDMLANMPEQKKNVLHNALQRNYSLTSVWTLSFCKLTVYKEGFLVKLEGTRSQFSVYAKDNDGELEFMRKPAESKLNVLYAESTQLDESDFENF